MADLPEKRIGNFRILGKLGQGGERIVFRAECLNAEAGIQPGDIVALSCLRDRDPRTFDRESRILRELSHPNILRYRHSFVERDTVGHFGDLCCLVTEFLDGETLKSVIDSTNDGRGLPWNQVKGWVRQILEALEYASSREVIHRDLKPANIFITRESSAKLIDFGIARLRHDGDHTASVVGVKGSWDYMAPDFAKLPERDFRGDERSDIYSFGVCLYHMVTGQLPYESLAGEGAAFAFQKRWSETSTPPRLRFRHAVFRVIPRLRAILESCLSPDRSKRPPSFGALRRELQDIGPLVLSGSKSGESYECTDFLGDGGFGEVFLATWKRDGKEVGRVAVKQLKASATANLRATATERFEREANLLKSLHHPNLVAYIDFRRVDDQTGPRYFLVLEYLPGMPEAGLRSRIARSKTGLAAMEVLSLFGRYLDALEYLHFQGIIHRDIKPHNLYAPEEGEMESKIFDLGIALDLDASDKTTGPIPGSWDYMPPEFATPGSGRGTPASDLYSLGITLYQALTGHLPFPEIRSTADYLERAAARPPISFGHPVFKEYPELASILESLLAVRPVDRCQDAGSLRQALRRCLGQESGKETETDPGGISAYRPALARAVEEILDLNFRAGAEICQSILGAQPQAAEAAEWLEVAKVLEAVMQARGAGDNEGADQLLSAVRRRFPDNQALLPTAGELLSGMENANRSSDWAAVDRLLHQACRARPSPDSITRHAMIHVGTIAAEIALGAAEYIAAKGICEGLLRLEPGHSQSSQLLGLCQILVDASTAGARSDWPRAVRQLRNGTIEYPESVPLRALLKRAEIELTKQEESIAERLSRATIAFRERRLVDVLAGIRSILAVRAECPPAQALLALAEGTGSLESMDANHGLQTLEALRGRYPDSALGPLGLLEIGEVLDERIRELRTEGTTVDGHGGRHDAGQGETGGKKGSGRRSRWGLEAKGRPVMPALATLALVVVVFALLQFQKLRSNASLLAALKADFGKKSELQPDPELASIFARNQSLQGLDQDLRQWWPKYTVTNSIDSRSTASDEFSKLLMESLQLEPSTPSYAAPDRNTVSRVVERWRAKQSASGAFAALCQAWNQYFGDADRRADLSDPEKEQRQVVAEIARQPEGRLGLAGFERAFRRATNTVTAASNVERTGTHQDIASQRARQLEASRESREERTRSLAGGKPVSVPHIDDGQLDPILDAFRVWFGLRVNDGTIFNPTGYQPRQGDLAEKLLNTSRSRDLPSEERIRELQAKFENAGKLSQEVRDDFALLIREARTRTRR